MTPAPRDRLSQTARNILKTNVADAYTRLVVTGAGNADAYADLKTLSADVTKTAAPAMATW